MHAARQRLERASGDEAVRRAGQPDREDRSGEGAPQPRRVEQRPAAAVVLAPIIGLCIWGGLIALLVF